MSDWTKVLETADALQKELLDKKAFLPMPPDQVGAAPPPQQPPQGGMDPAMQQGGAPMPPAGPPPQGGPQGGPPMQQPPMMDPMQRLDQLEQMVGEQQGVIQELMAALGEDIGPALEQVMQKMTTHDNAILEVSTLASGASNDIKGLIQELSAGAGAAPAQQPQQ